MSDQFWLRCDKCGRSLDDAADRPMQLVALFKPSAIGSVPKTHPEERRAKCRSCGYVNIFNPVEQNSTLTENWRENIVLKRA